MRWRCENCGKRVVLPWRHLSRPSFFLLPHDTNEWMWMCSEGQEREEKIKREQERQQESPDSPLNGGDEMMGQ